MNASSLTKGADNFAHFAGYPLFIVGTLANIVCIIVLNRPIMRATNLSFYLQALAVNDIFVLDVGLMDKWLWHTFDIQLRRMNPFLCKLLPFLDKFLLEVASWIVVAVSMERMVAVCIPIRYRNSSKCHRPLVLLIIMTVVACVNAPILYYYELDTTCHSTAPRSYLEPRNIVFYLLYWAFPLLSLLTSSVVIVRKLQSKSVVESKEIYTTESEKKTKRKLTHRDSVYLLVIVNCLFIICISPFAICGIIITVLNPRTKSNATVQRFYTTYIILHIISYLTNAINFVPYMLTSRTFRKELKALFRIRNS